MRGIRPFLLFSSAVSASASAVAPRADDGKKCPGYKAINVEQTDSSLTAQLRLAGEPCDTYGKDLENLKLTVEYQTDSRLHVLIEDEDEAVYQVPESVFPRPSPPEFRTLSTSAFTFSLRNEPFSFSIARKDTEEVLFDTTGSDLVFQDQYLKLRTSLPDDPNISGLGEHTDKLRLNTTDYVRTLWNRDSYGIPPGTNLYGSHPIYVDHRGKDGTNGVFLLNSNGMDILIDKDDEGQQYLEYNTLGGVLDFYFFAGPTPKEVSQQYAEVAGLPVMMPYWGFGFHQCRYGYEDAYALAEVVANYSKANIPLETMWADIDYMEGRQIFTLDPERFPINEMRALVDYLHDHDQHFIVMVDPAVSTNEEDNPAYPRGVEQDVFLKLDNGSYYRGNVWPGVTVYPDWFHPGAEDYWSNEFLRFFDAESGVDIDALWIDMNEAANFCHWPCLDPEGWERENGLPPDPPPVRGNPRPLPGFPPVFQPGDDSKVKRAQPSDDKKKGLPGRNLTVPPYEIHNEAGALSNMTIATDLIHDNGLAEYDVHNLYGIMMSVTSREAMLRRRPDKRPLIITRSTFAGAGKHVGKWLGDNLSQWEQYRISIAEQLAYAAIFQVPYVGSDTCGFGDNTTETLCARWAMLGAFSPFYRNHNEISAIDQEFYRWPLTAKAAQNAIEIRYKLLDYIYTAFYRQTQTGDPVLNPLFYVYPEDENAVAIDLQFFYGDSILVSPVTQENSTNVDIYLPDDIFYEYKTGSPVRGEGDTITLDDVPFTEIPLHIRGGSIIPRRTESANTTTALRKNSFEIVIAPGLDGKAKGSLYVDDGESLEQDQTLEITFSYDNGLFKMEGEFGTGVVVDEVKIASIWVLGQEEEPETLSRNGKEDIEFEHDKDAKTVTVKQVDLPFTRPAEVRLG